MDFTQVQAQLNDLPDTFKRESVPYTQLIDSLTGTLVSFTAGVDGITAQEAFANATDGWADFWGLLFGIPRDTNESNTRYKARVQFTLNSGAGPALAIQNWIISVWGVAATVKENLPEVGYSIMFPPGLVSTQIAQILVSLARIRPAGVPFQVFIESGGLYLETINFLDTADVTGAYLTGGLSAFILPIGAITPNIPVLLPDLFLVDPLLAPTIPA